MKRAIYRIPASTTFETLTEEQQDAIRSVQSQWALPMPGTIVANGMQVVDGIVADSFDPDVLPILGLGDWQLLGLYGWDEQSPELTVIAPLDMDALLPHLPDAVEYDEDGNVTGTSPAVPHVPHGWAGWPQPEITA